VSVLEHRGQLEWGVATLLALLGWAYLELGQIGQAEEAVGQALARARATSNRLALVDVLRVQVMLMIHQKHWVEAASNLEEGLALARSMPYPYGEGRLLHVYGAMHVHKGELEPACERLEAALAVFRRLGARKDAERVEQTLSTLQTAPLRAASVPALPSLPARQAVVAGASTSRRLTRTERQAWALEQLRTAGPLSPHAYAAALAVSDDTALRDLQELVDQGLVQAAGTTKDRRYVLAGAALGPAIHRTTL
jgi:tetratricopeptide (TPR) repeat protein